MPRRKPGCQTVNGAPGGKDLRRLRASRFGASRFGVRWCPWGRTPYRVSRSSAIERPPFSRARALNRSHCSVGSMIGPRASFSSFAIRSEAVCLLTAHSSLNRCRSVSGSIGGCCRLGGGGGSFKGATEAVSVLPPFFPTHRLTTPPDGQKNRPGVLPAPGPLVPVPVPTAARPEEVAH
jgi:hypothetical protein